MMPQRFSLFTAGVAGIGSGACLFLLSRVTHWIVWAAVAIVWLGAVGTAVWMLSRGRKECRETVALLTTTIVGLVGLISIVEIHLLQWFLIALGASAMAVMWYMLLKEEHHLAVVQKPIRRLKMMIWVWNAYALLTTVYAIGIFFPLIRFWVLALAGGALPTLFSYLIWRMYFAEANDRFTVWLLLLFVMMVEIIWVMQILPFGYLLLGVLTVWLWYLLQLLIRFHMSRTGIIWKKQRWFLAGNTALFSIVLAFARWV